MELTKRQLKIVEIVKNKQPISGEKIAGALGLSRATLRNDFSILTMTGVLQARPKVGYVYAGASLTVQTIDDFLSATVQKIMVPPLIIKQKQTIYDAITILFMYDVGSLYVTDDDNQLVGLLSRKDLLRASLNMAIEKTPVAVVMTRTPHIITCTVATTLLEAGQLLLEYQVDSLPIVAKDDARKVIGKITKSRIHDYIIERGSSVEE
ncbi:helix-turn-helix transcriptional regulator [Agrilactobacillus yilanensis]|uniref:Helix-turn-helix transcriptional regulator n=1 Tax=Agrilactobacillus yilanensis TaxID=2485997 RepID=A0ABW4J5Y5_9LACO|nr:helix-turn-helix transcriptional regulator [Agrilactobacillus yilanensis]